MRNRLVDRQSAMRTIETRGRSIDVIRMNKNTMMTGAPRRNDTCELLWWLIRDPLIMCRIARWRRS